MKRLPCPVGIMPSVEFAVTERELTAGDVVVLVSDGVVASGTEWLVDFVANCDEEETPTPWRSGLRKRRRDAAATGMRDDVTALVLVVI